MSIEKLAFGGKKLVSIDWTDELASGESVTATAATVIVNDDSTLATTDNVVASNVSTITVDAASVIKRRLYKLITTATTTPSSHKIVRTTYVECRKTIPVIS